MQVNKNKYIVKQRWKNKKKKGKQKEKGRKEKEFLRNIKKENEEKVVIHRGMGTLIALSTIAIILIGFFPSGLMGIALDSIPF